MTYALCRQCKALLISKHRHDFSMCGCDNKSFIDGGDSYLRCGGVDISMIERLDIAENDNIVNVLYDSAIAPVIRKLANAASALSASKFTTYKPSKIVGLAEDIISGFKEHKLNDLAAALKFVIKSYVWLTEERDTRKSVKVETGYYDVISGFCSKYSTNLESIENLDVKLSSEDRAILNGLFRECEKLEFRRFNEDTSFCVDVVKYRAELFELLNKI